MNSLHIKKGDTVKLLSGKDKGKSGKVLEVFPNAKRVAVEGLNIRVRYSKPRKQGEKGQRMELPGALDVSKVMLICPNCGKPTRVAHDMNENGKSRKCKKCGKVI
jgi:large subunit ribosomal protein L24